MKKLIISVSLAIILLAAPAAAQAQEPIDLMTMQEAGLSSETLGRYLAQNLGGQRAAPPVDANLLTRLAQYGGDPLARAYLDLDRQTTHLATREFSPEVVGQLMASGVSPDELIKLLNNEAARYAAGEPTIAAAGSMISSQPVVAPSAGDQPTVAPTAPKAPAQTVAVAPPLPPASPSPQMTAQVRPAEPQVRYQSNAPQAPARPQLGFQQLRPGQAADPGSPLPLPYSTYDIRNQRLDGDIRAQKRSGNWMGVQERELPNSHVVEANTIGDTALMGQEVYARPSGHQVYRYYTGNPDNPQSGADPRQEQRNREDLQIIYQNNDRHY